MLQEQRGITSSLYTICEGVKLKKTAKIQKIQVRGQEFFRMGSFVLKSLFDSMEYGHYCHDYDPIEIDEQLEYLDLCSVSLSKSCDNVRERCFRHIAMGRRNWLQTGSHFSAQNLIFMFGLLESCKLNKVNFGEYIEDILTRILCGEKVDASFLPCDYVRHFEDGTNAEVTKTSQAVA